MSSNIRFPNITAASEAGQLAQVKSYLRQLVEQLNYSLASIESGSSASAVDAKGNSVSVSAEQKPDPVSTFNGIKALIIKSASIVNAYYEEISKRLEGLYVAASDFGVYTEQTASDIKANSTAIEQVYTNLQKVITDTASLEDTMIEVNAHIHSGLLYYDDDGAPVYGLEIGQRTEIDGEEGFNKYARFTSDKLSFYDSNDNEVAYISDKKLYITHVEVTGSFSIGGFVDTVLSDGSIVTKWVGNGGDDSWQAEP